MIQKYLLLLFLGIPVMLQAQSRPEIPDSLLNKGYDFLDDRIYQLRRDSIKASVYLYSYLHKSKQENNFKELVNAYQNLLHQSPPTLRFVYADSMLYAATKSHDNSLIGSAYLSKGVLYYADKNYHYALKHYIKANIYISQTKDQYLTYKVKYHIANVKYYLGFYDEAISLFKECVVYFKNVDSLPYLNSIHSLSLCYNRTGNYNLSSETNKLGLSEGKRLNDRETDAYFIHCEGINHFFKNNYQLAIHSITTTLPAIILNEDFANESIGHFYIGKSYLALHEPEKALPHFLKVDDTFTKRGYLRPDLREVYELLIHYYKSKNDLKMQLHFIGQLLKADKTLNSTYKYLVGKVHKEYDTKELLEEREHIRSQLEKRKIYNILLLIFSLVLLLIMAFLIDRHFKNKKKYQKKYDEWIDKAENKDKIKTDKPKILDINEDAVANVIKQLEKFERDKKFLEKELTLVKLAAAFNSNTKYLSQIIHHYREKGFVDYINDLKVDYLITVLHKERKIRNYTNKALAEEAGFSSTQRFVNAFYSRTGMPPSYFIEKIKNTPS